MFLKLSQCAIIWYLLAGFKGIISCSVHSIRFVKNAFSTKLWFVKTSTRIEKSQNIMKLKYESRVVKSNPVRILRLIMGRIKVSKYYETDCRIVKYESRVLLELKMKTSIRYSRDTDSLPMGRRTVVLLVCGVGKCCG